MKIAIVQRRRIGFLAAAAGGAVVALAPSAMAQYSTDFEGLGSGVVTGQDGYYIPAATTSVDFTVEAYSTCPGACNFDLSTGGGVCDIFDFLAFQDGFVGADPCACDIDTSTGPGVCDIFDFLAFQDGFVNGETGSDIPVNPTGGSQYVKGVGPAGGAFARAQRDITWPATTAVFAYDILCGTEGTPGSNNLGSFSLQPFPGGATAIQLFRWDAANPGQWETVFIGYNAVGTQTTFAVPGPEFTNLDQNKWYRLTTAVDFPTNQIIKVSITDVDTGNTTSVPVADVYLEGGSAGGTGHPTGFRFFGGGGAPGNYTCWDNAEIN